LASAYRHLSLATSLSPEDPVVPEIERRLTDSDLPPGDRETFHFVMVAILDRAGRYGEAFDHAAEGLPFTHDLRELGRYFRSYQRLMDHWRRVLPLATIEVRYEEMVANTEDVSRRIIEFCGLPRDSTVLDFHLQKRHISSSSMTQVRRPIYTSSVNRSRHYRSRLNPLVTALDADTRLVARAAREA